MPAALQLFFVLFLCAFAAGCGKLQEAERNRSNATKSSYVRNNLAQLSAAGREYAMQNNVQSVGFDDIVGKDKLLRTITPVDGEDYRAFDYSPRTSSWTVVLASGHSVTYERKK